MRHPSALYRPEYSHSSKKGFHPNSISPNTELRGGGEIGSDKSSYAAPVPGKFDALEKLELFGPLGTLCEQGGIQLFRGSENWLASARFVLGVAPTVPGVSRLARK